MPKLFLKIVLSLYSPSPKTEFAAGYFGRNSLWCSSGLR